MLLPVPAWLVRVLRAAQRGDDTPPASPTTEPDDAAAGDWWPPARRSAPVVWVAPGPDGLQAPAAVPAGGTAIPLDDDGWPIEPWHGAVENRY